ncbi:arabinogalactan oligomer / maltooligosaccharide transport system permease protein [Actinobaculum suis]|uniref:Arabinogalactan oligomer / maltooligosaccharide transport system permease protein n=2 Tax=Actinobaculum suis TaxID=1657 RepID=A0A1G7ABH9_9ACTO|nr:arabinogalactan oligomer / maltooligosaccharide transport system permease protein [Actinobaculum suis]
MRGTNAAETAGGAGAVSGTGAAGGAGIATTAGTTPELTTLPKETEVAQNHQKFGTWFRRMGFRHVVGIVAVIYSVFPILYVLSAALNPSTKTTLTGANKMFSEVSLANFTDLSNSTLFWMWFGNTLIIAICSALGAVVMGAAAAYAFSRFRFKGREIGLMGLMVVQMFPQLLAFVAIFLLLTQLGQIIPQLGLDSKLSLICVYLGGALGSNTFLMYGTFNSIPKSLDEAAKIDGATHGQVYWRIILPLVVPTLAVVALLAFIGAFNDYVLASTILTSQDNWTLSIGMNLWVGGNEKQWGWFAAGAVIAALPILLLFLFLQRYIVSGLTGGAVKG